MAARLKEKYHKEIKQALQKELGLDNPMAVPRLDKIVVNMGLGEATQNTKLLDPLVADLTAIVGQKPVTTKAKKSIAAFKVRAGMSIGAMVTLRSDKAYEFLDRLISTALPRVRDFRGVSTKSFDGGTISKCSSKSLIVLPSGILSVALDKCPTQVRTQPAFILLSLVNLIISLFKSEPSVSRNACIFMFLFPNQRLKQLLNSNDSVF